ncbi:MAG: sensor histidine kinase [Eubacterium sp.]
MNLNLVPFRYSGNEDLFSEVWINLLDNAIKFSSVGGKLSVQMDVSDSAHCTVSIRDSGCGMDSATQQRIFEQFYQGDSSHKKEGSGLGLAIVAKVLELHGAKIDVQSKKDSGSCFRVVLSS